MQGLVKIKISGLNLLRIIDRLILKNVVVQKLVIKKTSMTFFIDEKDLVFLDKICKIERKFYKILYKSGLKQFFYRIPYMFGTLFVFILTAIYFYTSSLFIGRINLSFISDNDYDLSKVQSVLADSGIVSGSLKNQYKTSDIQKLIMLEVDDVENCVVKFTGQNLNIIIYPLTLKNEIKSDNIYSKYDCVIESAKAYSGNLKVKAGDIIKKGDILIENDGGASGEIIAKVYFSSTKIYNENQQEIIYTGNILETKDYFVCGKIKLFDKNSCNFNNYLVEKCIFFVNKNLFLPILCEKTVYREIQINNKIVPFESVKDDIKNQVFEDAKTKLPYGTEIVNVTYSLVSERNFTRVDCFIETKINLI